MTTIDLNADVGEGFDDDALLPLVTRASLACGGHAGDRESMRRALVRCRELGVAAGAHPSYRDRAGFGRRELGCAPEAIARDTRAQVERLAELATALGVRLRHLKPHGALYLRACHDRAAAAAVVDAARAVDAELALLAPPLSQLVLAATDAGLPVIREGFVDRRYLTSGKLAPRSIAGALIREIAGAVDQGLSLARGEAIVTLDGGSLRIAVDSLCLHGDAAGAAALARALRAAIAKAGLTVAAFLPSRPSGPDRPQRG